MYSPILFPLSQSRCANVLANVFSSAKFADRTPSDESSSRTTSKGPAVVKTKCSEQIRLKSLRCGEFIKCKYVLNF